MSRYFVVAITCEMPDDATRDDAEAWAAAMLDVASLHSGRVAVQQGSLARGADASTHPFKPAVHCAFDLGRDPKFTINVVLDPQVPPRYFGQPPIK